MIFDIGRAITPPWQREKGVLGLLRDVCYVPGDLLNDGLNRVELHVSKNQKMVFYYPDVLVFEIHDSIAMRNSWYDKWPGTIRPALRWTTELVEDVNRSIL
jgi:lipopolysaccharide transport system ATP-binding protein